MANKNTKYRNRHKAKAVVGNDGVVSCNRKRNSAMRVYLNQSQSGQTQSLTSHEALLKHESMGYPNHKYLEYRKINLG